MIAQSTFEADHFDPDEAPRRHGHDFHVEVTERDLCGSIKRDLDAVTSELHLKSLDDMLYGGSQTFDGIASWIMERLIGNHPKVVSVTVTVGREGGRYGAVVERDLR